MNTLPSRPADALNWEYIDLLDAIEKHSTQPAFRVWLEDGAPTDAHDMTIKSATPGTEGDFWVCRKWLTMEAAPYIAMQMDKRVRRVVAAHLLGELDDSSPGKWIQVDT